MNTLIFNKITDDIPLFRDKEDLNRLEGLIKRVNNNIQLKSGWWKNDESCNTSLNIVEVLAYNINKNFIYILIKTDTKKNRVRFILRLKTAYAMYYNKKYNRKGPIFCSGQKNIHIVEENITKTKYFINRNPLPIKRVTDFHL